jgi:MerR family transcriptional regulator/heat shock protein HspR
MAFDELHETPVYAISVVAQLTGMHPQTLRQYDRLGLVTPQRTPGGGRRYSAGDVDRLREIQQLSADGIGLVGVKRILDLEQLVGALRQRVADLESDLDHAHAALSEALSMHPSQRGDLVIRDHTAVVVWRKPPQSPLG